MSISAIHDALAPVVEAKMRELQVPGVSVGVLLDGTHREIHTWGVTSVESPRPVTENTLFQIGSTGKVYTATAVMRLVERGVLTLDTRVQDVLPGFGVCDPVASRDVTVQHLLTHHSGWFGDHLPDLSRGEDALERLVESMADGCPQVAPLGHAWSYNNNAFCVAGRLVEVLEKQAYETAVTDGILRPLGMSRTFLLPEDLLTHELAVGHTHWTGAPTVFRPYYLNRGAGASGAAYVSCPDDQLTFAQFHLGTGPDEQAGVLSRATRQAMQQPLAPAGFLADEVGTAWMLERVGDVRLVKHGGSLHGQMSAFVLLPEHGFAITVLTNSERGHELNDAVVSAAVTRVLGLELTETEFLDPRSVARDDYVGRYRTPHGDVIVSEHDEGVLLTVELAAHLRGIPMAEAAVPPPTAYAMLPADAAFPLGVDRRRRFARIEFVRDPEGQVQWLRFRGQLAPRAGAA